jgi:GNAT superfamily N-acetyltransferase
MTETIIQQRRHIQHLLDTNSPADGLATYYALFHPPERTTLTVHRDTAGRVDGFLVLCRTGMDLFRPLLTMRVQSREVAADLLEKQLPTHSAVMIVIPLGLRPVIEAFFSIGGESVSQVYELRRGDFRPVINVLVTRSPTPGGDPKFVIRGQSFDRGAQPTGPALATAGINWRSPRFAEIYVHTEPAARGRGLGKSVASAVSNWLLEQGITPIYTATDDPDHSVRLALGLGFTPTGAYTFFCDGVRRPASVLSNHSVA